MRLLKRLQGNLEPRLILKTNMAKIKTKKKTGRTAKWTRYIDIRNKIETRLAEEMGRTNDFYVRQILEPAYPELIYNFGHNHSVHKISIWSRISGKINDFRIWLGERIAGKSFYDDYDY